MKTIRERIEAAGIRVTNVTEVTGQVPEPEDWPGARSFRVTMHNPRTEVTITEEWETGPLADAYPNEPDELLNSLSGSAVDYLNASTYEEYAEELDMDPDSRKGEQIYRAIGEATERLRRFLGDDFDAFLWETEQP